MSLLPLVFSNASIETLKMSNNPRDSSNIFQEFSLQTWSRSCSLFGKNETHLSKHTYPQGWFLCYLVIRMKKLRCFGKTSMCTDALQADRQWDEIRWQADRASMMRGFGDSESCFHSAVLKKKSGKTIQSEHRESFSLRT